jgi:hypothetical protein
MQTLPKLINTRHLALSTQLPAMRLEHPLPAQHVFCCHKLVASKLGATVLWAPETRLVLLYFDNTCVFNFDKWEPGYVGFEHKP